MLPIETQLAGTLFMVRPRGFGFNEHTAQSNVFQKNSGSLSKQEVAEKAREEFENFITLLRSNGIRVIVRDEDEENISSDSVFPNNWISFHGKGSAILYPMMAPNRRRERNSMMLEFLKKEFSLTEITDLTGLEEEQLYLEGTGSLVLDRLAKTAYACISQRTHPETIAVFCEKTGYQPVLFTAVSRNGQPVYHTNVMMSIGENTAILCGECIPNKPERDRVYASLEASGKKVLLISENQVNDFAGNMLQVRNKEGKRFWIMSARALRSLTREQVDILEKDSAILSPEIPCIEEYGGGSVRCMLAEVF